MKIIAGVFVVLLILCAGAGAWWYFTQHPSLQVGVSKNTDTNTPTATPSPRTEYKQTYTLSKEDAAFLGVIANSNGSTSGFIGTKNGELTRLPDLPEKASFVSMGRGGTELYVVGKSPEGKSYLYWHSGDSYQKVYGSTSSIEGVSVSPDGSYLGFITSVGGTPHALVLKVGSTTPKDLGPATAIRMIIHEKVLSAWVVRNASLVLYRLAGNAWSAPQTLKQGAGATPTIATNGASRVAFVDSGGAIKEFVITSVSPLSVESLGSYNPIPGISLYFKSDRFYGFRTGQEKEAASLVDLKSPEKRTEYPIRSLVPGVVSITTFNP